MGYTAVKVPQPCKTRESSRGRSPLELQSSPAECFDDCGDDFEYWIGDLRALDAPIPDGMQSRAIPAATWANFTAVGPIPDALQRLNREIYADWLPNNAEWRPSMGMNIEWYSRGDMSAADYESGILIPVEKSK